MKIKKNIAISESGFIFNPGKGESFSTNAIGMQIIKLLQAGKDKDEIKDEIMNEYVVDEVTFEKDYYDFEQLLGKFDLAE